ncbi:MAG: M20 family metallopeptidase, partial [Planctomycetia bacterium]|nr:M20 family metallopeptidase [Planctomycetia bacterium]
PGRDNILAVLPAGPAAPPGPPLMWEAHQDTVPVDGMVIDPFRAEIRDGRVYGRGACDVKGGMAAMLTAVARLAAERPTRMPAIVVACTVDEENGFTGAEALVRGIGSELAPLLPGPPSACIVLEPTLLEVVVAHRGVVRWRCSTTGRAAHSADPSRGDNAIYKMAHVVVALEKYLRDVLPGLAHHPLCGRPTMSVGTIAGGSGVNIVPDQAMIEIDRRLIPGESPNDAIRHIEDYLLAQGAPPTHHGAPFLCDTGLSDGPNGPLAARLIAAGAVGRPIGVPYSTNASAYAAAGIPTVVFGPGSIQQAHTVDEWIAVEQLAAAVEVFMRLGRGEL